MLISFSRHILFSVLLSFILTFAADATFENTKDLPVAYQGRFRSLESASRLWLYDTYHKQQLKKDDLSAFHTEDPTAINLYWHIHFLGHAPWDPSPFFWIHYASLKSLLKLESHTDRFSFNELNQALFENKEVNLSAVKTLILSEFAKNYRSSANRAHNDKIELQNLSSGLWVTQRNNTLVITKTPTTAPWHFLKAGMVISEDAHLILQDLQHQEKNTADSLTKLLQQLQVFTEYEGSINDSQKPFVNFFAELKKQRMTTNEISQTLETRFPFNHRLLTAGTTLKMLPVKSSPGEWVSLHAFKTLVFDPNQNELVLSNNFTSFSNEHFLQLREAYFELEKAVLTQKDQQQLSVASDKFTTHYQNAYATLAGEPYRQAQGKFLTYPTTLRLQAETLYYQLPLIEITLCFYALALILMFISITQFKSPKINKLTLIILLLGFAVHTTVLIFRCYILQRPPVSNMFETVVYVPWIAVAIGLIFYQFTQSRLIIAAATFASFALLVLLKLTQVDSRLENVQAVLDSQYWLIIHVLMVVGSYGAFAICGILGHFYLIDYAINKRETAASEKIARGILHTMYVGVALLIPGTILGGVWAAESWGRFWDWDPKESWAFISACVYLLFIHAYTFRKIHDFGLAVGSIAGLIAISFTWYGVNYVLGTGLHSYGFGSGGESLYFLYVAAECLFVLWVVLLRNRAKNSLKKIE